MPARLNELYAVGRPVEILLVRFDEQDWWAGLVVAHQHPGIWVRTEDGRAWFVTNRQRIRPTGSQEEPC